jgi:hypothetical protein
VLLVFDAPCQLRLLAGPEHGRTIPLADVSQVEILHCSGLLSTCYPLGAGPAAPKHSRNGTRNAMPSVREWLASLGLSEYADRFAEHRIDFSILQDLTDKDLKEELGIVPLGDRRKLLQAIAKLAGLAGRIADEVRIRDQPQDRQGVRPNRALTLQARADEVIE